MRVLVTGAAGLIGRVVTQHLRTVGHEVHTTSRRPVGSECHHVADLAVRGGADAVLEAAVPAAIIHLAGAARGSRFDLYRANVLTTIRLMEAVTRRSLRPHVVVVGSAAEYGDGGAADLDEQAALHPVSDYGCAKVSSTTLAQVLADENGLSLTVARPFNVVSDQLPETTALGNLRAQLLDQSGPQRTVRCGRLGVIRDFVPVAFVADALTLMATERLPGTFNVCSGIGITPGAILDAMAALLRTDVEVEPLAELSALPAGERSVGNPAKLAALGLSARPTAESLARVCLG